MKITNIEEVYGLDGNWSGMDGYKITTDNEEDYYILIDSYQSCCESWGYFTSDDNFSEYIGSELINVAIVDEAYNQQKVDEELGWGLDCGDIIFVNFETSIGILQFAAYNAHNGYYGHNAIVKKVKNGVTVIIEDTTL